ncbi:MAG: cytochrome P450 [Acidimicrobiales bacterium]
MNALLAKARSAGATLSAPRRAMAERLSSPLLVDTPGFVDEALLGLSRKWTPKPLATPPTGSALQPVMGDAGIPLLGHTIDYIRFGSDLGRDRFIRFGPVSWMGAFGTRVVVVAGPAATQEVLANSDKAFSQDGWTFLIDSFFHRGLMLMSFDEHLGHRRIMQEAFTRERLTGYVQQVVPRARVGMDSWPDSGTARIYPLLKELTLDIATDVFMGGRGGADTREINDAFVATVRAASSIVRAPIPGTRFHAGVKGRRTLERYFTEHLPAARRGDGDDLFANLCRATTPDGERFSDADIVNHMIFLMMAAHDTSTIATTAAAYYLGRNPVWQERVRAESEAVGSEVDIETLEGLGALDLVVKESLRLLAPVPLMMRKAVKDASVAGCYIPADTLLAVAPAVNHFDTDHWTKPDEFDPERFGPDRQEDKSHRNAWLPFGGGVHKCIGLHFGTLEVKAILHEMLLNCRWSVPDGYDVRWDNTSLPIPADGLPVHFERLER